MNDERLARRAAAGDAAAFEEIFRRYHQDLYRYCLATVGNPQDAQDAMQNTMVKAMQALPGEKREIKLKPWLYRVARNEAIETLRRRREGVQLDSEREATTWEIAESTAARERLRQLFADLEELPERQRSALVMRELAGLDFGEIGASFDTSAAVARQTLYEARLSLRQMDEGREMRCESVLRALSDADGRVTRRRDLRAHLRGCASCRDFREGIAARRDEFAAIAPLPLALSAGVLQSLAASQASVLGTGASPAAGAAAASGAGGSATAGAGGLAGTVGAGVAKTVAGATIAKSAATVAVVAVVGASAADRGGVVDLPLWGGKATEAGPALERRSQVADDASANPAAPGQQVRAGRDGDGGPHPEQKEPQGSASPAKSHPGAAGQSMQAGGSDAGRRSRPSTPGRSEAAPGRSEAAPGRSAGAPGHSQPQGSPGHGSSPGASRGARTQDQPPAASRGEERAAARKPPQGGSPTEGVTKPPPKPEKPGKSGGATTTPTAPVTEPSEAGAGGSAKGGGTGKAESTEP
jgi:RNA polymerase sigma factor (sigma-70 family)